MIIQTIAFPTRITQCVLRSLAYAPDKDNVPFPVPQPLSEALWAELHRADQQPSHGHLTMANLARNAFTESFTF